MAGESKRPSKANAGRNKKARSSTQECSSKNWVELDHSTEYPEDRGQSEPAAFTPFRVTFGNGSQVDGKLNQNGFARFDDIPEGDVQVEYEPGIDQEIARLRRELKQGLDEIIAVERAEYDRIEKILTDARVLGLNFPGSNTLAKADLYVSAVRRGLIKGVVGTLEFAWDAIKGSGKLLYELGLRLNPITAPQKFLEDLNALKAAHEKLKRFSIQELEAYVILMTEPSTYSILQEFGKNYLKAQHSLEWSEAGGELMFDVALDVVTGGVALAANSRHVAKVKKLQPVAEKLVDAHKRKHRRQRKEKEPPNRKIVTKIQLLKVACFCPYKGKTGKAFNRLSKEEKKAFLQEYDRQLRRQQDAINNMTVEEFRSARDAFEDFKLKNPGKASRNPAAKAAQQSTRDGYQAEIKASIAKSLFKQNPNYTKSGPPRPEDVAKILKESEARAEVIMKNLAALHDPDMAVGGFNKPKTTHLGSALVNSSIGPSWGSAKSKKAA